MHEKQAKFVRFGVAVLATMAVAVGLSGQGSRQLKASMKSAWIGRHALTVARAALERATPGAPQDWSHRHLIFSNPGPEENAIQNGRYDSWLQITNDPRFIIQQKVRAAGRKTLVDRDESAIPESAATLEGLSSSPFSIGLKSGHGGASGIQKDWAMGVNAGNPSVVSAPAKWSFDTTTASCANDFVVYPTGSAGSGTQATIIAYFNLYSGCGGTVPRVDFAYNTGGAITGAPSFSTDGSQLAFIQTAGGAASLVLLRIPVTPPGTGTLATPTAPTLAASAAAYTTCSAPCMFKIAFNGAVNDSLSNPWVDYSSDSLFVGDDNGKLHKFTPVFSGTAGTPPAEIVSAGVWPATLGAAGIHMASPVFDPGTGKVFVGSGAGFFYAVGGGTPAFLPGVISGHIYGTSTRLGPTGQTTLIEDGPIVDSAAGTAYVFVQQDTGNNNAVFQFSTGFTSGTGNEETIGSFLTPGNGPGNTPDPVLSGAFDNLYLTSEDPCNSACTPTGNLYVTGNTGSPATLYQIPITANVMGTPNTGPNIGGTQFFGRSSPITEFFDTGSTNVTATGTVTINANPGGVGGWGSGTRSVTIGTVTYTFVNTAPAASTATHVQVLFIASNGGFGGGALNEEQTARNLAAAISATATCQGGGSGCFGSGTVANGSVTDAYTIGNNFINLTSRTAGSAGDFVLTEGGAGITVSGGDNGASGQDFIFVSVLTGTGRPTGCPTGTNGNGCLMNFDVTDGDTLTTGTAPVATMTVTSDRTDSVDGFPTSQIIIDNVVQPGVLAGASQIYFLRLDNAGGACTSSGTGICATQASQTVP